MQTTSKYKFKKRELVDVPDITQAEDNWDKVEVELNNRAGMTTATPSANGLMAKTDKVKLDGIAAQANKTVITNNLATVSTGTALDAVQGKVLADQIGGLLPLNGIKKMIGFLEAQGGKTNGKGLDQIRMGNNAIHYAYIENSDITYITANAHNDGLGWKYASDGKASILIISSNDPPFYATAMEGSHGDDITWTVSAEILTNQTGVKLDGSSVMTGGIFIDPPDETSYGFYKQSGSGSVVIKNTFINGGYGEIKLNDVTSSENLKNTLQLYSNIPNPKLYNIYGEHNPPYVTGAYIGDGNYAGQTISTGFYPSMSLTTKCGGDVVYGIDNRNIGFLAKGNANQLGQTYYYIAFK